MKEGWIQLNETQKCYKGQKSGGIKWKLDSKWRRKRGGHNKEGLGILLMEELQDFDVQEDTDAQMNIGWEGKMGMEGGKKISRGGK